MAKVQLCITLDSKEEDDICKWWESIDEKEDNRSECAKRMLILGWRVLTESRALIGPMSSVSAEAEVRAAALSRQLAEAEERHRMQTLAIQDNFRKELATVREWYASASAEAARGQQLELDRMRAHYAETARAMSDQTRASTDLTSVQQTIIQTLQTYQQKCLDLETRVAQHYEGELSRENKDLKARLHEADLELARLKSSNFVKGETGERFVREVLANSFTEWTFLDTSGHGAQSDFHMAHASGDLVVVEVKNKAAIAASDVDKSMRDIRELMDRHGQRLLAYVFVSLRSTNLPRKGHLMIEFVDHVPVLWLGYPPDERQEVVQGDLARMARLVVELARLSRAKDAQDDTVRADVASAMRSFVDRLCSLCKFHQQATDAINAARKCMANFEDVQDELLQNARDCLKRLGLSDDSGAGSNATPHACPDCRREFKTLRGLRQHACKL